MIDFSLTEEQELLAEQVEEFMKRGNYDDYFKECDRERKYPEKACRDFCEEGFHHPPIFSPNASGISRTFPDSYSTR